MAKHGPPRSPRPGLLRHLLSLCRRVRQPQIRAQPQGSRTGYADRRGRSPWHSRMPCRWSLSCGKRVPHESRRGDRAEDTVENNGDMTGDGVALSALNNTVCVELLRGVQLGEGVAEAG